MIMDAERRTATFGDTAIRLSDQRYHVLAYLVAHPGMIRSRTQIMHTTFPGGGYEATDRAVDATIKQLRKLGIPGIKTYYSVGYYWEPE